MTRSEFLKAVTKFQNLCDEFPFVKFIGNSKIKIGRRTLMGGKNPILQGEEWHVIYKNIIIR